MPDNDMTQCGMWPLNEVQGDCCELPEPDCADAVPATALEDLAGTRYRSRADGGLRARTSCIGYPSGRPLGVACHWPGTTTQMVGRTEAQIASALRGWQAYHMDPEPYGRGWSDIAYSVAIDWAGRVWELRGLECRSAANGGEQVNADYGAVLWILGVGEQGTAAMIEAFRDWRTTRLLKRYPSATAVKTHNDVRPAPTECPGPWVTARVRDGSLLKPPSPQEDDVTAAEVWLYGIQDPDYDGTTRPPPPAQSHLRWAAEHAEEARAQATAANVKASQALAELAAINAKLDQVASGLAAEIKAQVIGALESQVKFHSPAALEAWGDRPPPTVKHLIDMTWVNGVGVLETLTAHVAADCQDPPPEPPPPPPDPT